MAFVDFHLVGVKTRVACVINNKKMRPNVEPAKAGERNPYRKALEKAQTGNYTIKGGWRKTIGDLCDFCLRNIRVKRDFMRLRQHGWKFACLSCKKEKKLEAKRDKVIFEHIGYLLNKNG